MKKLLQRVLFWDAPAAGAFFGLTLVGITVWLLPSFFFFLWANGSWGGLWPPFWDGALPPGLIGFEVATGLLLSYAIFLVFRFYGSFCRQHYSPPGMWLALVLLAISLTTASVASGVRGGIGVSIVFFAGVFPLLLLPKISCWLWLAQAGCWSLGILLSGVLLRYLAIPLCSYHLGEGFFFIQPAYRTIPIQLHLSGSDWVWLAAAGVLFLLLGYLLTALLWARAADLPCRRLRGRGVTSLWLLGATAYLLQIILAINASQAAKRKVDALEQRFNRPITALALGEMYYQGEQPDDEFWKLETELFLNNKLFAGEFSEFDRFPEELPATAMLQWREHVRSIDDGLSRWENLFSDNVPPWPRRYCRGELSAMLLPHFSHIRELNRVALWRVRLALDDGDATAALAAAKRQADINDVLLRETNLVGGMVWIACVNLWLKSVEQMLEAQALADEQLLALTSQLKAVATQVPLMQKRSLYSEAVHLLDNFEMLGEGRAFVAFPEVPFESVPMRKLRFFSPLLWWYAAKDKAYLARAFLVDHLTEIAPPNPADNPPLLLSSLMLPALRQAGERFHAVAANLLAMQALIKAELHRRAHGTYPERLENLPADPFNGEPLRYRHGVCHFTVTIAEWNETSRQWRVVRQARTGPGLQAWSVGPDLVDDDNINPLEPDAERRSDDIRALMRLK